MSREEVAALAKAIAKANGHTEPDDWASKVADAYEAPGEVAAARRDETKRREG